MAISMATIKTCERVINTYKLAQKLGAEFTRKEFDAATCDKWGHHKSTATLTLMKDEGLIKVVRKEECGTKEIELPPWEARYVMIDRNGNELMEEKIFLSLSAEARNAMLALNGEDFRVERKDTKVIQLTRDIYALNTESWKPYTDKVRDYVNKYANKCAEEERDAVDRSNKALRLMGLI